MGIALATGAAAEDPVLAARKAFLTAKQAEGDGRLQEALGGLRQAIAYRPEDPVLHYELAMLLHELDVDAEARTEAREAARLDPKFAAPWRLLGSIDFSAADKEKERLPSAIEELQSAHKLEPANLPTVQALARALLRSGSPDRARALLDEVPGSEENPGFFKTFAEADEGRGADTLAAQEFEKWLASEPGDREAITESIEFFESRRDFARAIELLSELEKSDPGNAAASDRIAQDLLRAGRFAEAEARARKAAADRPEDRAALRTLATVLYEEGQGAPAEEILRKLIAQDPDDPAAVFILALERQAEGKIDESIALLDALDRRVADNAAKAELHRNIRAEIASLRLRQKKAGQARAEAEAVAFSGDGVHVRSVEVLLQIARDEKKPAEGLAWARRAVAAQPADPDLRAAEAEFQILTGDPSGEAALDRMSESGLAADVLSAADALSRLKRYAKAAAVASAGLLRLRGNSELAFRAASALERDGKFAESEKQFLELLRARPDDAQALNYLGYMYADRSVKLPDSLRMLEKAVALDPRNGAYLDSLGWVHFRLRHYEKARTYLLQAAARFPDDATIQEHMGDIEARLGSRAEALAYWKKSLTLSPEEPEKIEKKIRELSASR
jgi:predicted Zn-dependent protease